LSITSIVMAATVNVTSVSLNKTSTTINVGSSENLKATVLPATATTKTVNWKSSNTAVAKVDTSGKVSGVSVGTATITVTTTNGKTATCVVTIPKPVTLQSLQVSPIQVSVGVDKDIPAGGSISLSGVYSDGTIIKDLQWSNDVKWQIADTTIADNNTSGKIHGNEVGTTTLTLSYQGKTASVKIVVTASGYNRDAAITYAYAYYDKICDDGISKERTTNSSYNSLVSEVNKHSSDGWKISGDTLTAPAKTPLTYLMSWCQIDCAHFVSRCLASGGLKDANNGVDALYKAVINSGDGKIETDISKLQKGDLAFVGKPGSMSHATIISKISGSTIYRTHHSGDGNPSDDIDTKINDKSQYTFVRITK